MSRRSAGLFALMVSLSLPAAAQEAPADDSQIARNLLQTQGHMAPAVRRRCLQGKGDDIVVCARDNSQFRAESTSQSDPNSREALNDGRLTPPDVAGAGIFKGKPTIGGMCLLPPCPAKAYMIDLSQIPLPPAGSDADKIAKGEIRAP